MTITALPTPPTREDAVNFAARGDAFMTALPVFATQANALAGAVSTAKASVDANMALLLPAAAAALGAANYKGLWSGMSGSLALPASVFHAGRFWILLGALANVALAEPGVSASWAPVVDDVAMVAFFPMSTPPAGWLKANGAAVSRTAYAALFARIGTAHGAGDGSTTFTLPDVRGEFLRALDDGRGVDGGRALGSAQSGQNASHTHTGSTGFSSADHVHSGTTSTAGAHVHTVPMGLTDSDVGNFGGGRAPTWGSLNVPSAGNHEHTFTTGGVNANHYHNFTTSASGGTETRPRNVALLGCIRF